MLRIYQSTSAEAAKQYYTDALSRSDYYLDGQEVVGGWSGTAARYLGLDRDPDGAPRPLDQKAFARLCDNLHPLTGERLTPRTRDDRTVGYDLSFHAPKGVSVLHALTGDPRIVEAMQSAVSETMTELEANTHTRVRLGGKSEDRHTGNLIWGSFTHFTTRPVGGVPDPHLHVHCFVFNTTFDTEEARWKAAQFRQVVRDHPYFQAAYHARLARNLIEIGYPVSRTPEGWDLHGIDRGLIDKFSRRTAEIEAECRRLGITDPAEKDGVGARTRAGKDKNLSQTELALAWQHRLTQNEAQWIHRMAQEPGIRDLRAEAIEQGKAVPESQQPLKDAPGLTAEQALEHAIGHVYERKAVESDRRLVAEALKYSTGDVTPEQVWTALYSHPELLTRHESGERWVTTREVHAEEKAVLAFAVSGRGVCVPLGKGYGGREGDPYTIGSVADREGFQLNNPQHAAVEHLISSRDRLMLLRGGAGTGKTTLLKEARAAIEHGGSRVFACAVTTDASRGVLAEAGFKDACPVQKVLTDKSLQERMAGQVIWVDEAGMVGTPTMKKLCDLADRIDARIVLSGDIKQQSAVERGDAMGLIERRAGIRPAEVNEILRQKGLYKQAVEAIQKGKLKESVQMLDELGAIREIRDLDNPERRHAELADRYLEATEGGKTAMVVSPTHAEGKQVTDLIREKLKDAGVVDREERTFTRLKDLQWTEAERADAHNYTPGMVVQFTQHCPGHAKHGILAVAGNTKAKILAVDPEKKLVMTEDILGNRRPLPLHLAKRFQVFEEQELKLAVGDQIRVTRNAHTLDDRGKPGRRVNNGTHYKIAGFTKEGHIRLDNKAKWVLHRNVGHINHGYCTTPQAAQGKSVNVFLAALSGASLRASTLEQIYVMVSRGTKSCELITDSRRSLLDAMARLDKQRSATELLDPEETLPSIRQLQLIAHAQEVRRMRLFEANRNKIMADRKRAFRQRGEAQRATPERAKPTRATPTKSRRQPPGRDAPGRER